MAELSEAEFAALVRHAGLALAPETMRDLHRMFPKLQAMIARNRGAHARPRSADVALAFDPAPSDLGGTAR
jgi:hypothetical protein